MKTNTVFHNTNFLHLYKITEQILYYLQSEKKYYKNNDEKFIEIIYPSMNELRF